MNAVTIVIFAVVALLAGPITNVVMKELENSSSPAQFAAFMGIVAACSVVAYIIDRLITKFYKG